jgi:hypothetical protein
MLLSSNTITYGSTVLLRNNQFDEKEASKELHEVIESKQIKLPYTLE